jgi:predicted kinase
VSTLILTRGLIASGKTTFALAWEAENPNRRRIVCRDDIREELYPTTTVRYKYTSQRESHVTARQEDLIKLYNSQCLDICVADTNLNPSTMARLKNMGTSLGMEVIVEDFTHIPLVECLQRDAKRINSIGETVIVSMWLRYLKQQSDIVSPYNITHPFRNECIVCDIDGTLANNLHRNPHNSSDMEKDTIIRNTLSILHAYKYALGASLPIFYCSGRKEEDREVTYKWLVDNNCPDPDNLYMRPIGDTRKDWRVKEDMAHKVLEQNSILFWLDDRHSVTTHLRSLGITVHSVNFGRF